MAPRRLLNAVVQEDLPFACRSSLGSQTLAWMLRIVILSSSTKCSAYVTRTFAFDQYSAHPAIPPQSQMRSDDFVQRMRPTEPWALAPLYDARVNLVGWMEVGEHIFDTNLKWLAYISDGHAWSANGGNWCGPVIGGTTCLDRKGRPVAWSPTRDPEGTMAPMRPIRPMRAMRPMRPLRPMTPWRPTRPMTPIGGWSRQHWLEWVVGE
jgi:hypothetical protein